MEEKAVLFVVATPIGNLKDITLRAIDVLKEVDFVIAEDRERALKLLSHLDIRKPIITINSYNEGRRARTVVEQLSRGKKAALITAAGTPCISDPGDVVVRGALDAGIEVQAVPGPCAALAALSISGLSPDRFLFYGFLPLKKGKKKKVLREVLSGPFPVVLFESPRRIVETIGLIKEEAPERRVVLCREITKLHEEVMRGHIEEVLEEVEGEEPRGEYTLIVEGKGRQAAP
ncbi:MAG: 16S rRNA (cytidine(1402)-2'-O)-methyltransferase [Syntrophorhabdales bacterium]|jgi:16S rRNA (cytidine1402-2'-O)-methyltransferase